MVVAISDNSVWNGQNSKVVNELYILEHVRWCYMSILKSCVFCSVTQ